MRDTAITCALVYVFIGSCFWVVLDSLGLIQASYDKRKAQGLRFIDLIYVLATLLVILIWPRVAYKIVRHPRKVADLFCKGVRRGV